MAAEPEPRAAAPGEVAGERVAKRIARAGLASRRDAERLIEAGRVSVDGETIATPATLVTEASDIRVDGERLPGIAPPRLVRLHKPRGYLTTVRDPEGRPTIYDLLDADMQRLMPVGRLDMTSEGLLLLTNAGALKRHLELPATGWQRRYRVRAYGKVTQAQLSALAKGALIEGQRYGPIQASLDKDQGSNVWLTMGLREGKNREVRRVLGHLGLTVNRLIRVSYGPFQLGALKEGEAELVAPKVIKEQLGAQLANF